MAFRDAITYLSEIIVDVLKTAESGRRIVIESTGANSSRIQFYSGNAHEAEQAYIYTVVTSDANGDLAKLRLQGPMVSQDGTPAAQRARLELTSVWTTDDGDGNPAMNQGAWLEADRITLHTPPNLQIAGRPVPNNQRIVLDTPVVEFGDSLLEFMSTDKQAIVLWPGDFNIAGGVEGVIGNWIDVLAPTGAVFLVSYTIVGSTTGGTVTFARLNVDGVALNGARVHSPNDGSFWTLTRTEVVTVPSKGFSLDTYRFQISMWNNSAASATIKGLDSTLDVVRIR